MKLNYKIITSLLLILSLILNSHYNNYLKDESFNILVDNFYNENNNSESIEIIYQKTQYNLIENISDDINVKFCPEDNCEQFLKRKLNKSKKIIKCAFYELDNFDIANILLNKAKQGINISLVIDDKYLNEKPLISLKNNANINIYSDLNRGTKYNNYMHNKYCIIDENYIITGSTNPTDNGFYKNNNNMIGFHSKYLSKNYNNDFNQMSMYNKFGAMKRSSLEYNNITLNFFSNKTNLNESYLISSYFCPKDNCAQHIINTLNKANSTIYFATFSFTNNDIEKTLEKLENKGIIIKGIVEKRNLNGVSSIYKDTNLNIIPDSNKYNMHNKYFIIDNQYVITGSMNPSKNGDKYKDEQILIIKNKKLVLKYINNFNKLLINN